jgi:hypothetical protein
MIELLFRSSQRHLPGADRGYRLRLGLWDDYRPSLWVLGKTVPKSLPIGEAVPTSFSRQYSAR